jgi:hypothetical protein
VYGVQKGALSISTSPFAALSANSTQHTYQVLVPSLNVFVDRKIVWQSGVYVRAGVYGSLPTNRSAGLVALGLNGDSASIDICQQQDSRSENYRRTIFANQLGPIPATTQATQSWPLVAGDFYEFVQPGVNFNLCPFPLQSLCNNITSSINDCAVVTNGDTLQEQILLSNTRMTQRIRTTPSKFDQYAWAQDDSLTLNGNMSTFSESRSATGEIPTGSWPITFYDPGQSNTKLGTFGSYIDPIGGQNVYYVNGRPVLIPGGYAESFVQSSAASTPVAQGTGPNGGSLYNFDMTGMAYWPGLPALGGASAPFTTAGMTSTVPVPFQFIGGGLQGFWFLATNATLVCTAGSPSVVTIQFTVANVQTLSGTTLSANAPPPGLATWAAASAFQNIRYPSPGQAFSTLLGQVLPNGNLIQPSRMDRPTEVCFQYNVAEPLVVSPFVWQDPLELNTVGLYGCTNIQFVMNLQSPAPACQAITQASYPPSNFAPFAQARLNCDYPNGANLIRTTGVTGVWSNVRLQAPDNTTSTNGPFVTPRLLVQFLTPGPDISLPMISNVPYTEFPRYFKQDTISTSTSSSSRVSSQTITLSSIPDILMVFVKTRKRSQLQNEFYYPISGIQLTFDNFSNLCANMTQEELYQCSVEAGLDMDWHSWRGYSNACGRISQSGSVSPYIVASNGGGQNAFAGNGDILGGIVPVASGSFVTSGSYVPVNLSNTTTDLWSTATARFNAAGMNRVKPTTATQLVGGPLMLRMGQDVSLSPGLAPGTLGNFSVQVNLTLDNSYGFFDAYPDYQMTIIAVNSGFLETVRGQSAVRKTILNMADVEAAHADTGLTTNTLRRLVGGARHHTSLAHIGHYARHVAGRVVDAVGAKRAKVMNSGLSC